MRTVPDLVLPERQRPERPATELPSSRAIELAAVPRSLPRRWSVVHHCDVCQNAVERYAVACHACGTELPREERPGVVIGRPIGIASDDEMPLSIDPVTGGWAPLSWGRPLVPPPRVSREPRLLDAIVDVPYGVWARGVAYPLFAVAMGSLFCCCGVSSAGRWTLLAVAALAAAAIALKAIVAWRA
jgi:hypothetical protein